MDLVPENRECPQFVKDVNNGWQNDAIPECPWSTTIEHLNEMYDLYGVGNVRNVLCLRLFASSIFEVATGPAQSQKLMYTIFGEDLIRNIATNNRQIYEAIEQTTQYLAWKVRKAQILLFRRSSPNHGWESVRKILIDILKSGNTPDRMIVGMTSSIMQDVVEANPKTWREDAPLLSRARFPHVFRVAVLIFNDTIGECLRNVQAEIVYEAVAARLCYFYARLAADTWRILVMRNGPKESTEWMFLNRCIEPARSTTRREPSEPASSPESRTSSNENARPVVNHKSRITHLPLKQEPLDNWKPLANGRKPLPGLFDDLHLKIEPDEVATHSRRYPSQKPLNRMLVTKNNNNYF